MAAVLSSVKSPPTRVLPSRVPPLAALVTETLPALYAVVSMDSVPLSTITAPLVCVTAPLVVRLTAEVPAPSTRPRIVTVPSALVTLPIARPVLSTKVSGAPLARLAASVVMALPGLFNRTSPADWIPSFVTWIAAVCVMAFVPVFVVDRNSVSSGCVAPTAPLKAIAPEPAFTLNLRGVVSLSTVLEKLTPTAESVLSAPSVTAPE